MFFALAIFIASFCVKSLHATDLAPITNTGRQLYAGMAGQYLAQSVSMLKGDGILFPENQDPQDTSLLARPPGYPIFLGAVYYFFGGSYFTAQLVQNLLNSISPALIFLIAGTLVSHRVAVASAVIAAVSHHLSYFSNAILPDSLCALPILLAVYVIVITRRRRQVLGCALAGALFGLSVWLRPNALLLGCFFAVAMTMISRSRLRAIKRVWILALMPFVVVAPITIRNYVIYGEFVPVSINMGIVLWEGIADGGGQQFGALPTDDLVSQQEAEAYGNPAYAKDWSSPDGVKRDRERVRKSAAVIAKHPFWFAGAMMGRMADMLKYSAEAPLVFRSSDAGLGQTDEAAAERKNPNRMPKKKDIESDRSLCEIGERFSWIRPAARFAQRITKETAQLFIALGAIIMFSLSWRRSLFILITPLYYLLIQSLAHTEFRYTLPMHYFLFIFAGATWVSIGYATWRGIKRLLQRWPRNF
jgi:dolichyl-phosphate-mannose-protein mannosyltransferase